MTTLKFLFYNYEKYFRKYFIPIGFQLIQNLFKKKYSPMDIFLLILYLSNYWIFIYENWKLGKIKNNDELEVEKGSDVVRFEWSSGELTKFMRVRLGRFFRQNEKEYCHLQMWFFVNKEWFLQELYCVR